jgi:hypothetical protein
MRGNLNFDSNVIYESNLESSKPFSLVNSTDVGIAIRVNPVRRNVPL